MTDNTHQAILQRIADRINDEQNKPPKGFKEIKFKAHYFDAGAFLDNAGLMVTGAFTGMQSRFMHECFLWFVISEDELQVQLNAVQIDEQNSWMIDDRLSQSTDMDVVSLEQTIERFCEFYSEFHDRERDDSVRPSMLSAMSTAYDLTTLYLAILNERFVQKSFLLSDPVSLDQLHLHLVKLGMKHLPKL